jgi:hypothetical protein
MTYFPGNSVSIQKRESVSCQIRRVVHSKQITDFRPKLFACAADFRAPLFDWWQNPNQVVDALYETLKGWNVNLGNAFWEKDPKTIRDAQLGFGVEKLATTIKVGFETATFSSINPDWETVDQLISLFDVVMNTIKNKGKADLARQEAALAMHVRPGAVSLKGAMAALVATDKLGVGQMYGVSVYGDDSDLLLDKSVRYPNAVFIRTTRRFPPNVGFADVAEAIYKDEMKALGFFGLHEKPPRG